MFQSFSAHFFFLQGLILSVLSSLSNKLKRLKWSFVGVTSNKTCNLCLGLSQAPQGSSSPGITRGVTSKPQKPRSTSQRSSHILSPHTPLHQSTVCSHSQSAHTPSPVNALLTSLAPTQLTVCSYSFASSRNPQTTKHLSHQPASMNGLSALLSSN